MTVKTQGGKVITKDGKVSCECCETPQDCCMYPAQALVNGAYAASNLPSAVTISGTSYSRFGTGYGDTTNGILLEGSVWAKYANGTRSEQPCLIQSGVFDQFLDSYELTYFGTTVLLNRISLCTWYYIEFDEFGVIVEWRLLFNGENGTLFEESFGPNVEAFLQFQENTNSPSGTYFDPLLEFNYIVSEP
jgi:hypothetical protein